MESLIVAHGATHLLPDGRRLFERLSFSLSTGITGLVGANGVGKSCLARILAGTLEPAEGTVRRSVRVKMLEQHVHPPAISIAAFLDDRRSSAAGPLLAGLDPAVRCDRLSGGQWMRVRLAAALDDAFLILDEPTNNLDRETRCFVAEFLRRRRGGTLLISHDRALLESCEAILELTPQGIARYAGGWTAYWQVREQERARLDRDLQLARRERDFAAARIQEMAQRLDRRQRHAARTAARGGMPKLLLGARKRQAQETRGRHATEVLDRAGHSVRLAGQALAARKVDAVMYAGISGEPLPAQALVAAASSFNVRYTDWVYPRDLEFEWRGNVRMAIEGGNGSGKSTLLKALRGERLDHRGTLRRGDLAIAWLDQQYSCLEPGLSVLENVALAATGTEHELRTALAGFLFRGDKVLQTIATLSGGERLRAALAVQFLRARTPQLLLLDEPTNNLDVANAQFLEDLVRGFRGALVVVSHDQHFLERCGLTGELKMRPARHFTVRSSPNAKSPSTW